jgi:hypothetical protein
LQFQIGRAIGQISQRWRFFQSITIKYGFKESAKTTISKAFIASNRRVDGPGKALSDTIAALAEASATSVDPAPI